MPAAKAPGRPTIKPGEAMLSITQAAAVLGNSRRTVQRMVASQNGEPPELPSLMVGGLRKIPEGAVVEYLNRRLREAG